LAYPPGIGSAAAEGRIPTRAGRKTTVRENLELAQAEQSIVRITRGAFEAQGELGYVEAIGEDLLLLAVISDDIWLNGFALVRIGDISELEAPHEHADFVEEALRIREESSPSSSAISLEDIGSAIRTAGRLFPLVVIHREEVEPETCRIGRVQKVTKDSVTLLEIGPDAEWEEEPSNLPLEDITRVDFGGGYEEALALVGGKGPDVPHLKSVT
jgi:hypothetical protein